MNGNKLFAASIAVLALALGFFLGSFCGKSCPCCNKGEMTCCKKMEGPLPAQRHGSLPRPTRQPSRRRSTRVRMAISPKGPKFKGKMDFAAMDSLLQVTPEQKAASIESRAKGDSIFKDLRKQKHDAEKALGEALESSDAAGIEAAKARCSTPTRPSWNTASTACKRSPKS